MVKFLNSFVERTLDKALKLDFNFDISADDVWQDLSYPNNKASEEMKERGIHIVLLENLEQVVMWLKNVNIIYHPR